jgi:hypothetical protein
MGDVLANSTTVGTAVLGLYRSSVRKLLGVCLRKSGLPPETPHLCSSWMEGGVADVPRANP